MMTTMTPVRVPAATLAADRSAVLVDQVRNRQETARIVAAPVSVAAIHQTGRQLHRRRLRLLDNMSTTSSRCTISTKDAVAVSPTARRTEATRPPDPSPERRQWSPKTTAFSWCD
ncbi:hypothetical protein BDP81DRAFT_413943 [Colletotrichum phormii]|uniref:Uncharacterized protein n=1 Tax=Colletotrichum phormii TaxID=359342 RepID=A0AAJ0A3V7_9PEZI|nr:uncharacterized protein BDP81DRAFT_413943 [Colletotrichum phormii]KAK1655992.1 hypothetical protein BDP81DRAFT_413943 [Colletotrichum phormii]